MKVLPKAIICIGMAINLVAPSYAAERSKAKSPDGRQIANVPGTEANDPDRPLMAWLAARRWAVSWMTA